MNMEYDWKEELNSRQRAAWGAFGPMKGHRPADRPRAPPVRFDCPPCTCYEQTCPGIVAALKAFKQLTERLNDVF
ncbi:unnamed protein product [Strongylus vulgaris]|uniref:Uncharacterized protein n=1 Tax=Strongylus vulgaris TaxID=40348 RepID=A0A3P7KM94_STRVU|nr:unnamed protein product [Strongylus vulgaris]